VTYDVDRIRSCFPALAEGAAHFDGAGGSQVPRSVADAVASTLTAAISNQGSVTPSARRADEVVAAAREAVGDFLGTDPGGVVFGRSMTQLTFDVARTLGRGWGPGDEVVVTRLDHDANIRPWLYAAAASGATVRWIEMEAATGELSEESLASAVTDRTRLVAVTAASNLLGTRPDVTRLTAAAHAVGALTFVDGVHLSAHVLPDVADLGADIFVCSPYKFCGPHSGVLAGRLDVLEALHPEKLLPARDAVPERFELGTVPYEILAGITAAIDFLAALDPSAQGSRRQRLVTSFESLEKHEDSLRARLETGLAALDAIVYSRAAHRAPTLLFDLPGFPSQDVQHLLAREGVNAPAGSFYALEASRFLGLGDDGAIRAGVAPYNDDRDVDRLLDALWHVGSAKHLD